MSTINYSEKIPNNVNLSEDRTLQRALEQLMSEHPVPVLLIARSAAERQAALHLLAAGALAVVERRSNSKIVLHAGLLDRSDQTR